MKHLLRAGILIAALFFAVLIAPRVIQMPASFASFGFHTSDQAVNEAEWASVPSRYAESALCQTCHQENYDMWFQSSHKSVACENCHGPAEEHRSGNNIVPVVDKSSGLCGTCHAQLDARPASFPQVDMDKYGDQACVTCHEPHNPLAGMPPKVPHSLEDRSDCQACHNPNQVLKVLPPSMPHDPDGREDCLSCHGPETTMTNINTSFLAPQSSHSYDGLSDCLTCHNIGGLRAFPPDHTGRTTKTCAICHRSK